MKLLRNGATRWVLITKNYAFKFPSLHNWKSFLNGLLANMQEKQFSLFSFACPVVFYLPGGFLVVMPRCEILGRMAWNHVFNYDKWIDGHLKLDEVKPPVENKRDSFGLLEGRIVAVDYGS